MRSVGERGKKMNLREGRVGRRRSGIEAPNEDIARLGANKDEGGVRRPRGRTNRIIGKKKESDTSAGRGHSVVNEESTRRREKNEKIGFVWRPFERNPVQQFWIFHLESDERTLLKLSDTVQFDCIVRKRHSKRISCRVERYLPPTITAGTFLQLVLAQHYISIFHIVYRLIYCRCRCRCCS